MWGSNSWRWSPRYSTCNEHPACIGVVVCHPCTHPLESSLLLLSGSLCLCMALQHHKHDKISTKMFGNWYNCSWHQWSIYLIDIYLILPTDYWEENYFLNPLNSSSIMRGQRILESHIYLSQLPISLNECCIACNIEIHYLSVARCIMLNLDLMAVKLGLCWTIDLGAFTVGVLLLGV